MKSIRKLFLALLLGLFTLPAAAEGIATQGFGAKTCAQFTQDSASHNVNNMNEEFYLIWATGFMSGINMQLMADNGDSYDIGAKSPAEEKKFLRDYCDQNPTHSFWQGVLKMFLGFPHNARVNKTE